MRGKPVFCYAAYLLFAVFLTMAVFAPTAEAAASLTFVATSVYWDSPYKIVVEGYFKNTGNKVITGITYLDLNVHVARGGDFIYLATGVWDHNAKLLNVELYPGETSSWTFTINTERYFNFSRWDVKSYYEYTYLR